MDEFSSLFPYILQREISSKLIFALAIKIIFSQITSRILNVEIEKLITKYLNSEKLTSLYRRNLLKRLQENFSLVKQVVYCTVLGVSILINLEDVVNKCLLILKVLGNLRWPPTTPTKEIIVEKMPEIRKAFVELAEKNKPNVTLPSIVPVKVPPITISITEKRTCEIFEKYIFTQKELLKTFERKDRVGMKERLTTYCTTQVNNTVKRWVEIMRKKSVTGALQTVKAQSNKALASIEQLPKNSLKSKDLTIDLLFTTRCIDSYYNIFKKETTLENLDYFKEKILPDLYIIFYAINNEAKK